MPDEPLRINVGCGGYPTPGWTNIDQHHPAADVHADFRELSYEGAVEIEMSHLLEHLPWRTSIDVLRQLRSWLAPQGTIRVEVPDMETILTMGTGYLAWVQYIYGAQNQPGEFHQAGFTAVQLVNTMLAAGFEVDLATVRRFRSNHRERVGFPCIEATGVNP